MQFERPPFLTLITIDHSFQGEGCGAVKGNLGKAALPRLSNPDAELFKTKIFHFATLFKSRELIS